MKLTCSKTNLLTGVNIALKAVPSKTTMDILQCILIDASSGTIKLISNDMELGIETIVEGEILEPGIIALDAKIFSDIVRKLPDNDITIRTDERCATTITCEKSKFNISGKPGDDFTYLPYMEKREGITLSQFTLREIIRKTIFSIADNDTNKVMTGELFEITDDKLKVVSLDGHRISIINTELKQSHENKKVIVPGKSLIEINKILSGGQEDEVHIYFDEAHVVFEFNQTVVLSRLIEGEYFRIEQMLSSDYETKITINKRELLNCIDRALLFVKEGDKKPIIINIENDLLQLNIESALGSMDEEIDTKQEGKNIVIGFNPKFLLETLRVIDDENITLYFVNPKAPCYIKDEKVTYNYLILPVNFNKASA